VKTNQNKKKRGGMGRAKNTEGGGRKKAEMTDDNHHSRRKKKPVKKDKLHTLAGRGRGKDKGESAVRSCWQLVFVARVESRKRWREQPTVKRSS